MADVILSEPKDYFFFLGGGFDDSKLDGILKISTPTIAKEILTCDKDLLANIFYPIRCSIWPLKIHLKI